MFLGLGFPGFMDGSGKGTSITSSVSFFLCHLDSRKIGMLRFLLEGYDGLATLTTLNVPLGLVCCTVPSGQHLVLSRLLADFNAEGLLSSFISLASGAEMLYKAGFESG